MNLLPADSPFGLRCASSKTPPSLGVFVLVNRPVSAAVWTRRRKRASTSVRDATDMHDVALPSWHPSSRQAVDFVDSELMSALPAYLLLDSQAEFLARILHEKGLQVTLAQDTLNRTKTAWYREWHLSNLSTNRPLVCWLTTHTGEMNGVLTVGPCFPDDPLFKVLHEALQELGAEKLGIE